MSLSRTAAPAALALLLATSHAFAAATTSTFPRPEPVPPTPTLSVSPTPPEAPPALSPLLTQGPPSILSQTTLAIGLGVVAHSESPIPLDFSVGGDVTLTPMWSASLTGYVTNGARFRNRIDYLSVVPAAGFHPLALVLADPENPSGFLDRLALGLAIDVGPSLEATHVGPTFHYELGLSFGLHLDVPLLADGSLVARLAIRHFLAPSVTFMGPMGAPETYGPPPLESFAGLAFTL
jgi:hypothetical protein